ncbi:30S ribosomal protein S8e, partial [Ralstonia pseudosolanacearum]|uniref:30S ribosomal protein S8e n=1 Tax=Ralstonia pseudosolanacearum TaxID=1310165 RepID=UPI003CEF7538
MGISRDSYHKRRSTGGRKKHFRKGKKYELGRQSANTKLSSNVCVRKVRTRGGNEKFRALRLDSGNFAWVSEAVTRKTRIIDVTYNSTNNELVRTQTLVKNAIVQIDATPFKQWYLTHYGVELGVKANKPAEAKEEVKVSNHVKRTLKKRCADRKIDTLFADQFQSGRMYACIASRPGQMGRCDGYLLEGKELEFYVKKMQKKKAKAA